MKNIILINGKQKEVIKKHLNESAVYSKIVTKILRELVGSYQPILRTNMNGIDFKDDLMIKSKIDGREFNPSELLVYFEHKYKELNPEFIKQVIIDWGNDDISDDLSLTKNISLYKDS